MLGFPWSLGLLARVNLQNSACRVVRRFPHTHAQLWCTLSLSKRAVLTEGLRRFSKPALTLGQCAE